MSRATYLYHHCSIFQGFATRNQLRKSGHVPQHDTSALHYSGGLFEGIGTYNKQDVVVFPTLHANARRAINSATYGLISSPDKPHLVYDWFMTTHGVEYERMQSEHAGRKRADSTLHDLALLQPIATEDLVFLTLSPQFIEEKCIETAALNFKRKLITNKPGDRWYVRPVWYRHVPLDQNGRPKPHMGVFDADCDIVFEISVRNIDDYVQGNAPFVLFRLPKNITGEQREAYIRRLGPSLYHLCVGHENTSGNFKMSANYQLLSLIKKWAKMNGFQGGMYVDTTPQQCIQEGDGMNVMLLVDGQGNDPDLWTPSTELERILPGTKRELALAQARNLGFNVVDNKKVPASMIQQARGINISGSWAGEKTLGYVADFPTGKYTRFFEPDLDEAALFLADQNKRLVTLGEVDRRIKHLQQEPHLTVISIDDLIRAA